MTLVLALILSLAPSTAEEEALLIGAIAEIERRAPAPRDARFRRVHLFTQPATAGGSKLALCGQVNFADPRAPPGWQVFAAAEVNGEVMVLMGNPPPFGAAPFCSSASSVWDYEREWSSWFEAALGRR